MEENVDSCLEILKKLIDLNKEADYSEKDTRAKLIDPLFKDCLGWNEEDIERDVYTKPDFLDYVFKIDGVRKFVLEAKKSGEYFEIPSSFSRRRYVIRGAITTDKPIAKAINQAQKYCVDLGVRYGFRYGGSWKDTKCIVFRSLEDIKDNLTLFSNLLSKTNVEAGSLREYVTEEPIISNYEKPIKTVHYPDVTLIRNYLTPFIQPLIDLIFKELTNDYQLDILKKCYVAEKQFRRSSSSLIRPLFDRLPYYAKKFDFKQLFETGSNSDFQASFDRCQQFLKREVPKGTLIVLEGGVGTGKTTFLHHFFNIVIDDPKVLWFYIDFKEAFPDPNRIEEYVFSGIVNDFEQRYRHRVTNVLEDFGLHGTIHSDFKEIIVLFSALIARGYIISLILDNVDRHYLTIPEFQEKALLVARNLTTKLKTITILTLREESFFKSIKSGVLDQFDIPKFHIPTPYFDLLIARRVQYTLDLLEKPDSEIMKHLNTSDGLGARKDEVRKFFEILRYSLRRKRKVGKEILRFLCDVSGGDMREALRFINTFCVSGNTNMSEMFYLYDKHEIMDGTGFYDIPFHHVIKSIMLGDYRYYRCARSDVLNVFDIDTSITHIQFLMLHVLTYLKDQVNCFSELDTGYISISNLCSEAEKVSITPNAIEHCLSRLALYDLVEFDNQSKKGFRTAHYVRITPTGEYYLEKLIHKFVYLDLVVVDTPIKDKSTLKKVRKLLDKTELPDRFHKTEIFLDYLKRKEEEEIVNNPEFRDSNMLSHTFMEEIIEKYSEEKRYIRWKRPEVIEKLSSQEE
jgi:hypothetical protein